MSDLISRSAFLAHLCGERDKYFREHFVQDPDTGAFEASRIKEECLEEMDQMIEFVEKFPGVTAIAKLVNNNQAGNINLIENAPNVTIDIGTELYVSNAT